MDKTPNCGEFDVANHENITLKAAHAKMVGDTREGSRTCSCRKDACTNW
jgi:hypothetical protein